MLRRAFRSRPQSAVARAATVVVRRSAERKLAAGIALLARLEDPVPAQGFLLRHEAALGHVVQNLMDGAHGAGREHEVVFVVARIRGLVHDVAAALRIDRPTLGILQNVVVGAPRVAHFCNQRLQFTKTEGNSP